MARQTKDEKQKNEIGFLSRWSARKEQVSKGEIVPDDEPKSAFENSDEFKLREGENLKEQDDKLTDEELLEKYNLPNPEQVENEAGLDRFLNGDFPGRIRQMALRRLWHMNPLFGEVCEMVEYGEDYTDAATVIEGMQTAYQVGKGYKTKAEELEVSDIAESDVVEGDIVEVVRVLQTVMLQKVMLQKVMLQKVMLQKVMLQKVMLQKAITKTKSLQIK